MVWGSSKKLLRARLHFFAWLATYHIGMVPKDLHPLFWDIQVDDFSPVDYPAYTIFRVLEYGDEKAVAWLRATFSENQIIEVLLTESRLTRKSANFWALVYGVPSEEVAALRPTI